MSVNVMKPTIVVYPTGDDQQSPTEKTRLITPGHGQRKQRLQLSYGTIVFLTLNRSLNLVLYKAFTTFSWYFSEYFKMNYTLFALIAVMNFPGNLLNILCVPYYNQFKIKYVIMTFEILLAISCCIILPWHNIIGLLIARLLTGFAITAARCEVNALIGAYTFGARRTSAIGIVEMSFGFSAIGFLAVGAVLQNFGWQYFFIGSAVIIIIITILVFIIIPPWYIDEETAAKSKDKNGKKYSYKQLREAISHKRLQLVFLSILLNKIARNAFYYTFSKWLSLSYNLGPQQAGYVTLCVAGGCLIGTTIVPMIVNRVGISIHMTCLFGAILQIISMLVEPIYSLYGKLSLYGACCIIFIYFAGCQIWYNNCLDIMIGVTPRPQLLPAVNTILLAYGAFGGMIGTIGSTVWYQWGQETAISLICAACNIGVACLVILLWIANKRHPYLTKDLLKKMGKKTKQPNILQDSSMALKIVGGENTNNNSYASISNLQNINEEENQH